MTPEEWRTYLDRLIEAVDSPNAADWIASIATLAAALVAIAAIGVAWHAGAKQIDAADKAREQTKQLDVDRSQPYVVMTLEPSGATPEILDLVIKNYGATSASDVKVYCYPWPRRSAQYKGGEPTLVAIPELPVLAPGQEWRVLWDNGRRRKDSELPVRHRGNVSYSGIDDKKLTSRILLDWSFYMERRWVVVRTMHDAAQALRDIRSLMNRFDSKVVGTSGLKVSAYDGEAQEAADWARYEAEMHEADPVHYPAPKLTGQPRRLIRVRSSLRTNKRLGR